MPHLSNVLRLESLQNNLRKHTKAEKTGATKLTSFHSSRKKFEISVVMGIIIFILCLIRTGDKDGTTDEPILNQEPEQSEAGSLNKCSCLAPALDLTNFKNTRDMILVTLCCAT